MKKDQSNCFPEPIAIIGIGCRFPGGIKSPDSFWEFLSKGSDGISETPSNRWSLKRFYDENRERNGKLYVKKGGFLQGIDRFDPSFFGISPKEAHFMDPQQRLLLEVTWESFENAGIVPSKLKGSQTGVYVGLFVHDYENIHSAASEHQNHGVYSATGGSATIAANRISNYFDLKGPSLIIDTACSSSMVGIHYACKDLWNGDIGLALASGVNLMLKPELSMTLCKASMLSPDGYCKTFDENANGYARAEGAATIILKRLSEAERSGDFIYATIRGTAVNQDGCGQGLTMPNQNSQESLIRKALNNSNVDPRNIHYAEAHGTGTEVGDPIEANSLGNVLGNGRSDQDFCIIGSVKSNFGHTEAAAGIAGVIKTALMLKQQKIPPNLHFNNPNPQINFDSLKLRVPIDLEPWPENTKTPRLACVNSFGFGGTNAHAVLQEYKYSDSSCSDLDAQIIRTSPVSFIPLSAKSEDALDDTVRDLLRHLKRKTFRGEVANIKNIGYTAAHHRTHFSKRACVVTKSQDELIYKLEQYQKNNQSQEIIRGSCLKENSSKSVFIFSGMGQQWIGMGEELIRKESIVRATIEECDDLFRQFSADWSLMDQLSVKGIHSRIHETQVAQPCIFALQVALARLWEENGVLPDAVVGHSVGEIAACHIVGAISLEDALSIAFHRSRLQQLTSGKGTMLAVGMTYDETMLLLKKFNSNVSIGAINSPTSVTLSGDSSTLKGIAHLLDEKNIFNRFLNVEVPYHSPIMDQITSDLKKSLSDINPENNEIPLVSTVTGRFISGKEIDANYWAKNVRQPVLFEKALKTLIESNHSYFIEIGAHPVLKPSIREVIVEKHEQMRSFHSIERDSGSSRNILNSAAELYVNGYPLKWGKIYPKGSGTLITLPSYPFQRERFWNESKISGSIRVGKDDHPELGNKSDLGLLSWIKTLDAGDIDFLENHIVQDKTVFPAAAYIELIRSANYEEYETEVVITEDLNLISPLILDKDALSLININLESDQRVTVYSKKSDELNNWTQNANGIMAINHDNSTYPVFDPDKAQHGLKIHLTKNEIYNILNKRGLIYGNAFQLVQEMWKSDCFGLGRISIPDPSDEQKSEFQQRVTLLDASFHVLELITSDGLYLPTHFGKVYLDTETATSGWAYCEVIKANEKNLEAEITLYADSGKLIASFEKALFSRIDLNEKLTFESIKTNLYDYVWLQQKNVHAYRDKSNDFRLADLPIFKIDPQSRFNQLSNEIGLEKVGILEARFDDLCLQYIVNMLHELGIPIEKGITFDAAEVMLRNGIKNHFKQLFLHLLTMLERQKILVHSEDTWEVNKSKPAAKTNRLWSSLIADYPILQAELFLLSKCGSHLYKILTGQQSPLSIIYSSESTAVEHLYQHSPVIRVYNTLMKETVVDLVDTQYSGNRIKILEIGAGTGSLASYLLPALPENKVEYTYTDIAPNLLSQAKDKFNNYPFIEFRTLDITRSPLIQDFTENSFDIIVSSLTLHATPNIKDCLRYIKELLSRNGTLLILEITKNPYWLDMIFGTLKGWWSFIDNDLRSNHPIIDSNLWKCLLHQDGFSDISVLSDKNDRYVEHAIFIARSNPEAVSPIPAEIPELKSSKTKKQIESKRPWIIVSEGDKLVGLLKRKFEDMGMALTDVKANTKSASSQYPLQLNLMDFDQTKLFFEKFSLNEKEAPNLIYYPVNNSAAEDITTSDLEEISNRYCQQFLNLINALTQQHWQSYPNFWLVTKGAYELADDEEESNPIISTLWGMRRVAANEYPGLESRSIDLGRHIDTEEIDFLIDEFLNTTGDDEIALRGGKRYVNRLFAHSPKRPEQDSSVGFYLSKNKLENKTNLLYQRAELPGPLTNEVQIVVNSTSLNSYEITDASIKSSGKKPWSGYGAEFSGVITKIGAGIKDYKPGQKVFGICYESCSSVINVKTDWIAHKPEKLSHFAASTIPLSFVCAGHILSRQLPIQSIKTVFITNATDEIGLALLQLLSPLDIDIYATVNTTEKLEYLNALGIKKTGLTGDDSFIDLLASDESTIPDTIINISDAPLSSAEFGLLKPYHSRLIQISQCCDTSMALSEDLPPGISFQIINPLNLLDSIPGKIGNNLEGISSKIDVGSIYSFPFRLFNLNEYNQAIDYQKDPNRIGKTCIMTSGQSCDFKPFHAPLTFEKESAYLIAGGLKGIGLATASWLVSNGAKFLILVSRQGPKNSYAADQIKEFESQGVKVIAESVDIADEASVKNLFKKIESESICLKGIIHSAMVLDIALMAKMNPMQMSNVLRPKVPGTWNLYKYSKPFSLDFFIFYSSLTATLGFSGQANYAAGNCFCNAMAHYMRKQGINAHSINWGLIDEAGWVARHDEARESVEQSGFHTQSLDQVWQTISYVLSNDIVELNVSPIDWSKAKNYMPTISHTTRLSHFTEKPLHEKQVIESEETTTRLNFEFGNEHSLESIIAELIDDLAHSLGISKETIDRENTLGSLNFDSLIAVELGLKIKNKFKIDIPKVLLLQDNLLIEELGELIQKEILRQSTEDELKGNLEKIDFHSSSKTDLLAETSLPEDIVPSIQTVDITKEPSRVLLTGATGFLGASMLRELIDQTQSEIVCLVRPKSTNPIEERVYSNLSNYGLWREEDRSRIKVINSDLSRPRLGLPETLWNELAQSIDVIYHAGAWLNFAQPYSVLKPTNVDGTKEMLRLACEHRSTPFHYISTLIKISQTSADPDKIARQGFSHNEPTAYNSGYVQRNGFNIGYHQSKWVAEELVLEAESRGLPVTIYRPSLIAANSQTGLWNENDYICLLINGCMEIGMAPDQDLFFDFCPVDYISEAIVYLSRQSKSYGNNYLLKNPNPIKWNDLICWLSDNNQKIELVPPDQWLKSVQSNIEKNVNSFLYGLLTLFEIRPLERIIIGSPPYILSPGIIENNVTRRALKPSIKCPPIDDRLLKKFFHSFQK